jgi:hypothetical protein
MRKKPVFRNTTNTGRFIMFSVITNIYNKKTKGPTLMEFFTATGKLKKCFLTTRDVRCVHSGWHGIHTSCVCVCELDYHLDVCRVTRVVKKKKLFQFSCGCEQFH